MDRQHAQPPQWRHRCLPHCERWPGSRRHLQWLLAVGLEDHRKHVARLRLRCEELKHALGETREQMLREGRAPDHARMRALHRRFHEVLFAYHFFKWS